MVEKMIPVRAVARGYHTRLGLLEEGALFEIPENELAAWMERVDGKPHPSSDFETRSIALGRRKASELRRAEEAAKAAPKAAAKDHGDDKPDGKDKGKDKGAGDRAVI